MDMYDTSTAKGVDISLPCEQHANGWAAPSGVDVQAKLVSEERKDASSHGQTSWIASGIKIQEQQCVHAYPSLLSSSHHFKIGYQTSASAAWIHAQPRGGPGHLLRFPFGLLQTNHLPVMTTARIVSLVMDSYLTALYHMYDT